jgi:hypothetical protein
MDGGGFGMQQSSTHFFSLFFYRIINGFINWNLGWSKIRQGDAYNAPPFIFFILSLRK